MRHERITDVALLQRGIIPQTFICACCGSELDRDDHMKGHFRQEHVEKVEAMFGSNVCFGCADDFDEGEELLSEYGADDRFDEWKEAL